MFDLMHDSQLGELHFKNTPKAQLQAVVAIHSSRRGTALGGCRFLPYQHDREAIEDAIHLARSMSYKAALAELPQGGGKAVIMMPKGNFNRRTLMLAFADFINELNGRYITAVDSGTTSSDMDILSTRTQFVTSTSAAGNPSPYTAQGVLSGIKAAVKHQLNRDDLQEVHIAVQGLGQVGMSLAQALHALGARLTVSDMDTEKVRHAVEQFHCQSASPQDVLETECDLLAPCALGGSIHAGNIDKLKCAIVAGSANNQLESPELAATLHQRNILWAPDYAINAGGLIFVSMRHCQHAELEAIEKKIHHIGSTLAEIFLQAKHQNSNTLCVSERLAEAKLLLQPPKAASFTQQSITAKASLATDKKTIKKGGGHAQLH